MSNKVPIVAAAVLLGRSRGRRRPDALKETCVRRYCGKDRD